MTERPIASDTALYHRQSLLAFASNLTVHRDDPREVSANATVLGSWLEAATGPNDRRSRFEALHRADNNRSSKRPPDGDPQKLIAEAEVFYAFLKAA